MGEYGSSCREGIMFSLHASQEASCDEKDGGQILQATTAAVEHRWLSDGVESAF